MTGETLKDHTKSAVNEMGIRSRPSAGRGRMQRSIRTTKRKCDSFHLRAENALSHYRIHYVKVGYFKIANSIKNGLKVDTVYKVYAQVLAYLVRRRSIDQRRNFFLTRLTFYAIICMLIDTPFAPEATLKDGLRGPSKCPRK